MEYADLQQLRGWCKISSSSAKLTERHFYLSSRISSNCLVISIELLWKSKWLTRLLFWLFPTRTPPPGSHTKPWALLPPGEGYSPRKYLFPKDFGRLFFQTEAIRPQPSVTPRNDCITWTTKSQTKTTKNTPHSFSKDYILEKQLEEQI